MLNRTKIIIPVVLMLSFWVVTAQAQVPNPKSAEENTDETFYKQLKLTTGKDDALIYQAMGMGYFEQGKFEKSYTFFKKAAKLNPKLYWSWYYLGILQMADPREFFKKAIEANPRFAPPYYWLGRYYCKAKDIKESIKYFQDYIKAAKNDVNEADRIQIAEYFILSMQHGETDYDTISRMSKQAS